MLNNRRPFASGTYAGSVGQGVDTDPYQSPGIGGYSFINSRWRFASALDKMSLDRVL